MPARLTREIRLGPGDEPDPEELWIFGYGSLVWRPEFAHRERRTAWVEGWTRRFWQGSTDHRGVPGAPGRVVTLVRSAHSSRSRCWGIAYRVAREHVPRVLDALDHREKGGYDRLGVQLHFQRDSGSGDTGGGQREQGLMYVATPGNPNYLGPAPLEVIARQVIASSGPSGTNLEYVQQLAGALLELCPDLDEGEEDALALARLLQPAAPAAGAESESGGGPA